MVMHISHTASADHIAYISSPLRNMATPQQQQALERFTRLNPAVYIHQQYLF
jgi:hypothetical protein